LGIRKESAPGGEILGGAYGEDGYGIEVIKAERTNRAEQEKRSVSEKGNLLKGTSAVKESRLSRSSVR